MAYKVTIIKVRRTPTENINQELQWIGNSLGLFNQRDKDSSCFRVFITLVKKARRNEPLSSDEIAEQLHLSRGTVVHHLTRLMEAGIVIREREGYLLREAMLQQIVRDIQRDMENIFSELNNVAKEIDERLS
jgi:predicted transcriptional regulator